VQVWRKSKRVAEDASVGKCVAPSAGAYSKRNRSALDDITNSYMLLPDQPERMVTRSSLRAAQSQVRPCWYACMLLRSSGLRLDVLMLRKKAGMPRRFHGRSTRSVI